MLAPSPLVSRPIFGTQIHGMNVCLRFANKIRLAVEHAVHRPCTRQRTAYSSVCCVPIKSQKYDWYSPVHGLKTTCREHITFKNADDDDERRRGKNQENLNSWNPSKKGDAFMFATNCTIVRKHNKQQRGAKIQNEMNEEKSARVRREEEGEKGK